MDLERRDPSKRGRAEASEECTASAEAGDLPAGDPPAGKRRRQERERAESEAVDSAAQRSGAGFAAQKGDGTRASTTGRASRSGATLVQGEEAKAGEAGIAGQEVAWRLQTSAPWCPSSAADGAQASAAAAAGPVMGGATLVQREEAKAGEADGHRAEGQPSATPRAAAGSSRAMQAPPAAATLAEVTKTTVFPGPAARFISIRERGNWFADRTSFLPKLLATEATLYTRPRRFGKSLLLGMLRCALCTRTRFDDVFAGTWLASPAAAAERFRAEHVGKYHVLSISLAGFMPKSMTMEEHVKCSMLNSICAFQDEYDTDVGASDDDKVDVLLRKVGRAVRRAGSKLALLIDEYDSPITSLISAFEADLISGAVPEACKSAVASFKAFFTNLKDRVSSCLVSVIVMTGLTRVGVDEGGSGFNIAMDVTGRIHFESMCGLLEEEIRDGLEVALVASKLKESDRRTLHELRADASRQRDLIAPEVQWHLEIIRRLYNGYRFSVDALERDLEQYLKRGVLEETGESVYNPVLAIEYMQRLASVEPVGDFSLSAAPSNVRVSRWAVALVAAMQGAEAVLAQLSTGGWVPYTPCKELELRDLAAATKKGKLCTLQALLIGHGVATYRKDTETKSVVLSLPNEVARKEFLVTCVEAFAPTASSELKEALERGLESGDVGEFLCKAAASKHKLDGSIRDCYIGSGQLERMFQAKLFFTGLASLEETEAGLLRIEVPDNRRRADLVFFRQTSAGERGRMVAVVELKAMVWGTLSRELRAESVDALEAKLREMGVDAVARLGAVRTVVADASSQVKSYWREDAELRRFVVVMVSPGMSLVEEVPAGTNDAGSGSE